MLKLKDTDYLHRNDKQYSFLETASLKELSSTIIIYRPCLVQHLDFDSILFCKTFGKTYEKRRTPYFIDYINQLGISYEESKNHRYELQQLMNNHLKYLEEEYHKENSSEFFYPQEIIN